MQNEIIVGTVPAEPIDAAKKEAVESTISIAPGALRRKLATRPIVEGIPPIGTECEPFYLPVPTGATFTDGTPLCRVSVFPLSCEWFTVHRAMNCKEWNGMATRPAAFRLERRDEPVEPIITRCSFLPWVTLVLPEDLGEAEAAYHALIETVQSGDGLYLPGNGLGGFTGPCTVWGMTRKG